MSKKKIAVGGDHAGYYYKEKIKAYLTEKGHEVEDFGPFSADSADYPDFVHPACSSIEAGKNDMGILICGSGQGVAITANKHQGIRAALCWDRDLARLSPQQRQCNLYGCPVHWV